MTINPLVYAGPSIFVSSPQLPCYQVIVSSPDLQDRDVSVVREKSFYYVVGEQAVRPLWEKVARLASGFEHLFSKAVSFLPGANGNPIEHLSCEMAEMLEEHALFEEKCPEGWKQADYMRWIQNPQIDDNIKRMCFELVPCRKTAVLNCSTNLRIRMLHDFISFITGFLEPYQSCLSEVEKSNKELDEKLQFFKMPPLLPHRDRLENICATSISIVSSSIDVLSTQARELIENFKELAKFSNGLWGSSDLKGMLGELSPALRNFNKASIQYQNQMETVALALSELSDLLKSLEEVAFSKYGVLFDVLSCTVLFNRETKIAFNQIQASLKNFKEVINTKCLELKLKDFDQVFKVLEPFLEPEHVVMQTNPTSSKNRPTI